MFEENEVAVTRWVHHAASGTGAAARRDVTMFAQRHGMGEVAAHDVGVAVCHAVPYASGDSATSRSRVVVEAATDGEWLSVRIDGDADRSGGDADIALELLVRELVDHLEYGTRWPAGAGTSVLMEFPMTTAEADGATLVVAEEPGFIRAAIPMKCGRGGAARVSLSSARRRRGRRNQVTTACS